ncbi:hypothetical protein A2690_04290 [Candidatus Roizmanbacteria bacterium RIFCSPHIGHO2_01_FULL_39_12b]|uniref:Uncharacterized protein n=1 Tax=Candidatus Roizmanbacteria bacterium RIFCSPHIGHO2_01_FULL_39_12b TaxID=1802030 RepID=A0A1F7GC95_9BACT|nr:MAG: hypothetical protein A2690_04290 [Candidatus Roizmanbacteria bacterium RIFCSPHIGHO2_01_FULL_39_12b]
MVQNEQLQTNQQIELTAKQPVPIQPENSNRLILMVVGVIVVLTAMVEGYYFWKNRQTKQQAAVPTEIPLAEPTLIQNTPQPDKFAVWKTFADIATAKQNVGFLYCHAELAAPFRSLVRRRVSASQQ